MFPFISFCVIVAIIIAFGCASNPCRTCKWFVAAKNPKCAFYKSQHDILGGTVRTLEYTEHVRKNAYMCGEEGYMYESKENDTTPINPLSFVLLWPLNIPLAVGTGIIQFLADDEAMMLRGF